MGNTKIYTVRFPLLPGEALLTWNEVAAAAHSGLVLVGQDTDIGGETMAMIMVESNSMGADAFIDVVSTKYPDRWCMITRFDADDVEFSVTYRRFINGRWVTSTGVYEEVDVYEVDVDGT